MSIYSNIADLEKSIAKSFSKAFNIKKETQSVYEAIWASYNDNDSDINCELLDSSPLLDTAINSQFVQAARISKIAPTSMKNIAPTRIHWSEQDEINKNYVESLIVPNDKIVNRSNTSLLSEMVLQGIKSNSPFFKYANVSPYESDKNARKFYVHIQLHDNSDFHICKTIIVKEDTLVDQIIGHCLYLCEVEDFEFNFEKDLNSYQLYEEVPKLEIESPKGLSCVSFAKIIKSDNLYLKYNTKEIMVDLIIYERTSTSTIRSKNYILSLNNNFKYIITQYLQYRKICPETVFDVYLKQNKTYVKNIDVSMLTLKDHVDKNNQLEIELVIFDTNTNQSQKGSTVEPVFELFRHATLMLKLSSIGVNVAIDREKIEIDPLSTNKSLFGKTKNINIPINSVKSCSVKPSKSTTRKHIKIKYIENEVTKSVVIESSTYDIEEMKKKITESQEIKT